MTKRLKSSVTAKIFFITALMLMMICVLTYAFIAWVMPLTYRANLNNELSAKAEQFISQLQKSTLADCQPLLDQFARNVDANVYIEDDYGIVKSAARNATGSAKETMTSIGNVNGLSEQNSGDIWYATDKTMLATTQYFSFYFLSDEPDENYYNLTVTVNTHVVNEAKEALNEVFPWLILTVLAVSILGALFYSRFITRPIVKVSGIAKRMSELEFDWRCDDNRSDEIGLLGRSLNGLAEKLSAALADLRAANLLLQNDIDKERDLERQRLEFFSAVSHELKTPITVIKGQLEGMLGNVGIYKDHETYLAKCLSVACVMENMVQEILTVTKMDSSGFAPQMKPLDLTALVEKQLETYHDLMEQKYLFLQKELTPKLMISGDPKLLQTAISNLLSNAVRYSPAEETVIIRTIREKDRAVFSVENTGISISEKTIPHLFEAFFRVEQSRNRQMGGSGLGLYLVSRIAKLHRSECHIENSGKGVLATLSFPIDQMQNVD